MASRVQCSGSQTFQLKYNFNAKENPQYRKNRISDFFFEKMPKYLYINFQIWFQKYNLKNQKYIKNVEVQSLGNPAVYIVGKTSFLKTCLVKLHEVMDIEFHGISNKAFIENWGRLISFIIQVFYLLYTSKKEPFLLCPCLSLYFLLIFVYRT